MKQFCFLFFAGIISVPSFSQITDDTTDHRFYDDLLDHFAGMWTASGTVHEQKFKNIHFEGKWILNHQFFQVHETGNDTVPWLHMKYESLLFIGYDHGNKRYAAHLLNVFGAGNQLGYLLFGTRNGNEIKFVSRFADPSTGSFDVESFTWQPQTKSWHFVAKNMNNGKEEAPYLDLKIERQKE
ncbi:MAG: hypothetical protein KF746_17325 [Chitinophagaceae bacterium]|nr:hypothetical protein [Chitinophagaceae bacterium]